MKTALFLPGFQEGLTSRDYKTVLKTIESKGYKTVFVPISWKYKTIEDWVDQLKKVYAKYTPSETILAGFSYGAMTAFVCAADRTPTELWLFSLSPYFSEDLPKLKKSWLQVIGKRRVKAFENLQFHSFSSKITCKTLIFYGEKEGVEWQFVKNRAEETHKPIKNSRLIVVKDAHHDVADPNYIQAIKSEI